MFLVRNASLLISVVLSSVALAETVPPLKNACSKVLVGASIREWILGKDPQYEATLRRHFALVWPEYYFKMKPMQPARDVFDFAIADKAMDFAKAAGQKVVGHTLVWHESIPDWFKNGRFSREELRVILETRIRTTLRHFDSKYPGLVPYWDVVNEAVDENGQLRVSPWSNAGTAPDEYIALAFQIARQYSPQAKLFYNDYNIEFRGPKADQVYLLVSKLVRKGVPIDGIGFQMHVSAARPFQKEELARQMKRYSDLGLEIHVSEMEVRVFVKDGVSSEEERKQAGLYADALAVCLENPMCKAFVMCGHTDKYSWISENQDLFPGFGSAQIFDKEFRPKRSYHELLRVLDEAESDRK